jgi:hypothetical protein
MVKTDTIAGVIRGNIGAMWSKFRPISGLSAGEVKATEAERRAYVARLTDALSDVSGDKSRIVRELRGVFYDLDNEPVTNVMPTEDDLAGRVRARVHRTTIMPFCPACEYLGGSAGVYADRDPGEKNRGTIPVGSDWWCPQCYPVVAWFLWRQKRHLEGLAFPYPPPSQIFPRESMPATFDNDGEWLEFTDGVLESELVAFTRDYLESASGRAILDRPCLTPHELSP